MPNIHTENTFANDCTIDKLVGYHERCEDDGKGDDHHHDHLVLLTLLDALLPDVVLVICLL